MKKNELKEIKGLELKELAVRMKKAKDELAELVMDKNMKKLKDVKAVFKKRKELAKMLTILRQRKLLDELQKETV